ncbi:TetR/AcrR family transcriptional regulator [Pseudonocardia zijingensis]|jgi:AcrR family transcriptional regulator|uniref:HTH tetR-type domain-containing protein n=1 Tax=Pseudonocardia zijingensis TaxID=153376 RepID=A0ABN1NAC1_9PSEU
MTEAPERAAVAETPIARRERILDAAERVFAEAGYHATTLRQIAAAADVKLSLIGYHFESKLALYTAVFARRQHVNEERLRLLEAIEDPTAPEALDRIVAAFMDPVVALAEEGAWYRRLVLREAADPSSMQRPVIAELFDPMARRFIAALKQALPGKPPGFHEWAYLFAVGALTQSAFDDRLSNLTDAPPPASNVELLRAFITAGWRHG